MKRKWFMISLPNEKKLLCRSNGWAGLTKVIPYISEASADNSTIRPLNFLEVILFILGGRHASK